MRCQKDLLIGTTMYNTALVVPAAGFPVVVIVICSILGAIVIAGLISGCVYYCRKKPQDDSFDDNTRSRASMYRPPERHVWQHIGGRNKQGKSHKGVALPTGVSHKAPDSRNIVSTEGVVQYVDFPGDVRKYSKLMAQRTVCD